MTHCGCGFVIADTTTAPRSLRTSSYALRSLLSVIELSVGADVMRVRPAPDVWSVIEYAAHTRDAVAWYEERIRLVLTTDRPHLSAFDWDAACEERRYVDDHPGEVAVGLGVVLDGLADLLDSLDDASWMLIGTGSDGTQRRVADLAGRAAHEGRHHLYDIEGIWRIVNPGNKIER